MPHSVRLQRFLLLLSIAVEFKQQSVTRRIALILKNLSTSKASTTLLHNEPASDLTWKNTLAYLAQLPSGLGKDFVVLTPEWPPRSLSFPEIKISRLKNLLASEPTDTEKNI